MCVAQLSGKGWVLPGCREAGSGMPATSVCGPHAQGYRRLVCDMPDISVPVHVVILAGSSNNFFS